MRPSQYDGEAQPNNLAARPSSSMGQFNCLDNRAMTPNGSRPWNVVAASGPQTFRRVKPPAARVAAQNVKQVKDLPKQSTGKYNWQIVRVSLNQKILRQTNFSSWRVRYNLKSNHLFDWQKIMNSQRIHFARILNPIWV